MASVRYFAAAADAAGTASERLDCGTLGELVEAMAAAHGPGFADVLRRCSLLVDGAQTSDPRATLPRTATVDVLPPFAGG